MRVIGARFSAIDDRLKETECSQAQLGGEGGPAVRELTRCAALWRTWDSFLLFEKDEDDDDEKEAEVEDEEALIVTDDHSLGITDDPHALVIICRSWAISSRPHGRFRQDPDLSFPADRGR